MTKYEMYKKPADNNLIYPKKTLH